MKVALCCIGRLENKYAVEYVEYYKSIGFDKIFIYDNNYGNEEHFDDVLQPYIDEGFVSVIDFRNKDVAQLSAYNDCYSKYGNEYDWIAFFDFDEFLYFVDDNIDIKGYLSTIKDFDCVHVNWMIYDDNNLVIYEDKPLQKRFTRPMQYDKCIGYDFPENNHIKSIVKGGIKDFKWRYNPHTPNIGLKCCDNRSKECKDDAFNPYNFDVCYLKHYQTKTIEEFLSNKTKRGYPDRSKESYLKIDVIKQFFKINERTKEKEGYINSLINNKLNIFIGTQKIFNPVVKNNAYKIIVGNHEIENNSNLELIKCKHDSILDDRFYSELYMLDYVSKNVELPQYVGFCHNRRYFSFLDDIPNMDEIFSNYDAVCSKPKILKTNVKLQYSFCHNIEDLYIVGGIIADKYPQYANIWKNFINGNIFIPYNMFIMKGEDFKEYIDFIFSILDEYLKIVGTDINKRIESNKDKYLKKFYPNNTVEYQYRIGGYIAERLTNLFMMHKFKKIKTYPVILTEEKYNIH